MCGTGISLALSMWGFNMNKAFIEIWFDGDIGPASICYTRKYRGNRQTAFDRFTQTAFRVFPNAARITVTAL